VQPRVGNDGPQFPPVCLPSKCSVHLLDSLVTVSNATSMNMNSVPTEVPRLLMLLRMCLCHLTSQLTEIPVQKCFPVTEYDPPDEMWLKRASGLRTQTCSCDVKYIIAIECMLKFNSAYYMATTKSAVFKYRACIILVMVKGSSPTRQIWKLWRMLTND